MSKRGLNVPGGRCWVETNSSVQLCHKLNKSKFDDGGGGIDYLISVQLRPQAQ